jgi:hypothetical protein
LAENAEGGGVMQTKSAGELFVAVIGTAIGLIALAGWLQHLYTCFTQNRWGFLIAGAIMPPIGVIHGWGIWLGIW